MLRLNATLIFALSAACFVIPGVLIQVYQAVFPTLQPGTNYANETMQVLLNISGLLGNLGVLFFVAGVVLWYRESK